MTQILIHNSAIVPRGVDVILEYLKRLPQTSGIYQMLDASGNVLYIGKARNLRKRVSSYIRVERLTVRIQRMITLIASMEFIVTRNEVEALLLEANLIKRLQPRFNILLRDDKTFPHIVLTLSHPFPRLCMHRGRRSPGDKFYGPFASSKMVATTIIALQKAFLLRNCPDTAFANRTRPCLQYQIKRCTAPCTNKVSETDYADQVKQVHHFLTGGSRAIQQQFVQKMLEASQAYNFEIAARYRDRIRALAEIQAHQDINITNLGDSDIIAVVQEKGITCVQVFFFRAGCNCGSRTYFPHHDKSLAIDEVFGAFLVQFYENKPIPPRILLSHVPQEQELIGQGMSLRAGKSVKLLIPKKGTKRRLIDSALNNAHEALSRRLIKTESQAHSLAMIKNIFKLPSIPQRIEVFDNSHLHGKFPVAVMIVADAQGFIKSQYRKFNLKEDQTAGDDYAMIQEVIDRRFTREKRESQKRPSWPDLVILDGGQGQLNVALEVFSHLNITDVSMVAMAKGPDRHAGKERFFVPHSRSFSLNVGDPTLLYLQNLRDEAHRFAIKSHRERRKKALSDSPLDQIPGVGSKRKRMLLYHFGSMGGIIRAGVADLAEVTGISDVIAQRIYHFFH